MLFVVHAIDKKDNLPTRAKFYRAHRVHLDEAEKHDVDVVTAGTLVADDGETPVGSVFVVDARDRAAVDAFTRSDPYHVNGVWETMTRSQPPSSRTARRSSCFRKSIEVTAMSMARQGFSSGPIRAVTSARHRAMGSTAAIAWR